MSVDMKQYDRMIIEKDRNYLSHAENGEPVWHWSPYHAWWDPFKGRYARKVADKVGGIVRVFNPITGDIK